MMNNQVEVQNILNIFSFFSLSYHTSVTIEPKMEK